MGSNNNKPLGAERVKKLNPNYQLLSSFQAYKCCPKMSPTCNLLGDESPPKTSSQSHISWMSENKLSLQFIHINNNRSPDSQCIGYTACNVTGTTGSHTTETNYAIYENKADNDGRSV